MNIKDLLNEEGRKCVGNKGKCNSLARSKYSLCLQCATVEDPKSLTLAELCNLAGGIAMRNGIRYQLKANGKVRQLCAGLQNTCTRIASQNRLCRLHGEEYARILPPGQYTVVNEFVKFVVVNGRTCRGCSVNGCANRTVGHNKYCPDHQFFMLISQIAPNILREELHRLHPCGFGLSSAYQKPEPRC